MLKWVKKEERKALMVDPKLHHKVKCCCIQNNITMKDFIVIAIMNELEMLEK